MAGENPAEIVVGSDGKILTAPVGTAAPANASAAWPAGWVDLGYADEDGVTLRFGVDVESIKVWQQFFAVRRQVTDREATSAFNLAQWSAETVPFALGGADVTELTAGEYKIAAPTPQDLDERALGVEWVDGTKIYRFICPRGIVDDEVEVEINRSTPSLLPVGYSVLGPASGDAWYILTNDPALNPA